MARANGPSRKSEDPPSRKGKAKYLHFFDLPFEARDQLEKLKSGIILGNTKQNPKSILFVSYNEGEGTSTIAVNFAESLAHDKKYSILIVDANTRNPCLHKMFDLNNTIGFSELLNKEIKISGVVKETTTPNLSVIPSGKVTYHPSHVFDYEKIKSFLDTAKERYDFIVFDSCPVGKYYDSIVLASQVNGVILVVQAERTSWYNIKRAKKILEDKKIPILGTILNRRKYHIPGFIFERFFG